MHFWVSTTRGGFQAGFCCPRKIGTNWFIPAFVKSRLGESGKRDADGTMACCFSRKKSRKDWRISVEVISNQTDGDGADFQMEMLADPRHPVPTRIMKQKKGGHRRARRSNRPTIRAPNRETKFNEESSQPTHRREFWILLSIWLALALGVGLLAIGNLSVPGLYYD